MNPFTVVAGAEHIELSLRLRDELRSCGVTCVVLAETGGGVTGTPASAAAALAAVGISAVVAADPARLSSLAADLNRDLPRVVVAQPTAEATISELRARGWVPAQDEIYTEEELEMVTARLQDLGYA